MKSDKEYDDDYTEWWDRAEKGVPRLDPEFVKNLCDNARQQGHAQGYDAGFIAGLRLAKRSVLDVLSIYERPG